MNTIDFDNLSTEDIINADEKELRSYSPSQCKVLFDFISQRYKDQKLDGKFADDIIKILDIIKKRQVSEIKETEIDTLIDNLKKLQTGSVIELKDTSVDINQEVMKFLKNNLDYIRSSAQEAAQETAKETATEICINTKQKATKICIDTKKKTTKICDNMEKQVEKLVTERVLTLMGIFATIITVILSIGSVAGTWITSADSPNILFAFLVPVMITVITVTVLMGLIYTYSAVMTDNAGKARIIGRITVHITILLTAALTLLILFYPTDTPKSNAQTAFSGTVNASITYSANAADSDVPTDTQAETTDTQAVSETTSGFDTAVSDMTTAAAS